MVSIEDRRDHRRVYKTSDGWGSLSESLTATTASLRVSMYLRTSFLVLDDWKASSWAGVRSALAGCLKELDMTRGVTCPPGERERSKTLMRVRVIRPQPINVLGAGRV
jgi:hypothetical protein